MKIEMKPFNMYDLSGSWREMGVQYGQDCAKEIASMIDWWKAVVSCGDESYSLDKAVEECVVKYAEPTREFSEDVYEFMLGMAEGSGIPFGKILFLNAANEYMGGLSEIDNEEKPLGCTTLSLDGSRTADGKVIIAQNIDWHTDLETVVLRFNPDNGPRFLGFTFAGNLAQVGISEAGFGLMVNCIVTAKTQPGVPMYVLTQTILSCSSVGEAMARLSMANRGMAFNYMFANVDGALLDVETTCDDVFGICKEKGYIAHTNHFLTPCMQQYDLGKVFLDTYVRRSSVCDMVEAGGSEHSVETVKEILRNHIGGEHYAVCLTPHKETPFYENYGSVLSAIAVPEDGVVYATEYPCQNEYIEYRL